jgi:hypothetical protein
MLGRNAHRFLRITVSNNIRFQYDLVTPVFMEYPLKITISGLEVVGKIGSLEIFKVVTNL